MSGGPAMFTEWDDRFDILVGANIQDSGTEPCLDSGVHDWLYGEPGENADMYWSQKAGADALRLVENHRVEVE